MQNSEFEKNVQQQLKELKFTPSENVWDKVEAGLPGKNNRRRLFFLLLLIGVITCTWVGVQLFKNKTTGHTGNNAELNTRDIKEETKNNTGTQLITDSGNTKSPKAVITVINSTNKKQIAISSAKPKSNTIITQMDDVYNENNENELINKKINRIKTGGRFMVMIKKPFPVTPDDNLTDENILNKEELVNEKPINVVAEKNMNIVNRYDSSNVTNIDSTLDKTKQTIIPPTINQNIKKDKKTYKWQTGLFVAGGSSNVSNKLFSKAPVYFDALRFNALNTGTGTMQVVQAPENPDRSMAFVIGLNADKKINTRWKINTGINYQYQSNKSKVGSKVDSVVNFNVDVNKSISASSYYRAGGTSNYKNKFHFIELPVQFEYSLSDKSLFFVTGGTTFSYLLNSNALVYNSGTATYFTDVSVFNRLLFNITGGAGINVLQKSTIPFSVGYQFKYSVNSVMKSSLSKQHLINSLIYLKVPFKK